MDCLKQVKTSTVFIALALMMTVSTANAKEQSIHDRMFHHRAIDAVVWAMPLLNFKRHCQLNDRWAN